MDNKFLPFLITLCLVPFLFPFKKEAPLPPESGFSFSVVEELPSPSDVGGHYFEESIVETGATPVVTPPTFQYIKPVNVTYVDPQGIRRGLLAVKANSNLYLTVPNLPTTQVSVEGVVARYLPSGQIVSSFGGDYYRNRDAEQLGSVTVITPRGSALGKINLPDTVVFDTKPDFQLGSAVVDGEGFLVGVVIGYYDDPASSTYRLYFKRSLSYGQPYRASQQSNASWSDSGNCNNGTCNTRVQQLVAVRYDQPRAKSSYQRFGRSTL